MQQSYAILTIALIGIIIYTSYRGFKDSLFFDKWKFEIESILGRREYYRLFSSAFLHADIGHLLLNCFCFYSFAEHIELLFGKHTVLLIFFLSLTGGSLLSLVFHRNHSDYTAVGASGGVSGIVFASIFMLPGGSISSFWIPIEIPSSIFAVVYVFVSMYGIRSKHDNIGHEAHLGGAVVGMLYSAVLYPQLVRASLLTFIIIIACIFLFLIFYFWKLLRLSYSTIADIRKNYADINAQRKAERTNAELDELLAKVKELGIDGLSRKEKKRLNLISKQKRKDKQR
jgi:membrane associated rhomboid family serine protease